MIKKNNKFDVMIAGGGPAGLSALLWCSELGLSAILLEKEPEVGGQLLCTYNAIRNYLGIEAANGHDLRDVFLRHIESTETKRLTSAEILKADLVQKIVKLENGEEYSGRSIFIATGVRRRRLNVLGEEKYYQRGILESGAKARDEMRGKTVVIVGGGDAAIENAVILSETADRVVVVHRRKEFTARREFLERAKHAGNVEFVLESKITEISGDKSVDSVELLHQSSGRLSRIETNAVLLRIGVEPNTELFRGQIETDDSGYLIVDNDRKTTRPYIFAGGDVTNPLAPTISTAVGDGAVAIKAIFRELSEERSEIAS